MSPWLGVHAVGRVIASTENPRWVSAIRRIDQCGKTCTGGMPKLCGLSVCGLSVCENVCGSPTLEIREDHRHLARLSGVTSDTLQIELWEITLTWRVRI